MKADLRWVCHWEKQNKPRWNSALSCSKQHSLTHMSLLVFRVTAASRTLSSGREQITEWYCLTSSDSICLYSPPPPPLPWYFLQFLFTCWLSEKGGGDRGSVCVWEGKWNIVLSHGPQQAAACLISRLSCVSVSLSRMHSCGPSEQTDLYLVAFIYSDRTGDRKVKQ